MQRLLHSFVTEVDSPQRHVQLEWQKHSPTKLLLWEQFGVLEEVVVDYFVTHLIVVLDIDPLVLEDSFGHFDVVEQGVLCIVIIEQWVLVHNGLARTRHILIVLGTRGCSRHAHNALAGLNDIHSRRYRSLPSQELAILEFDYSHVDRHREKHLALLDVREDVTAM